MEMPNAQNPIANLVSHLSPSRLKTHLDSAMGNLFNQANQAKEALQASFSQFIQTAPPLARIRPLESPTPRLSPTAKLVEERLAGVPVYALANGEKEFVLVSGARTGKSLGLFCFKKEDAESLLDQMRSMNRGMWEGSEVVEVALSKAVQVRVDGIAFRFIPDSCQVANAIKEFEKIGDAVEEFSGVPVFLSRSLTLRFENKRYRPVFFKKEDLDQTLERAARDQRQLNPAIRKGDIQVGVLEEMIENMVGGSTSESDDVVFVPPGLKLGAVSQDPA